MAALLCKQEVGGVHPQEMEVADEIKILGGPS